MSHTLAPGAVIRCSAPAGAGTVSVITVPARVTAADTGTRRITGRILSFGQTGHTGMGRVRFAAGSVTHDTDLSGVKLLVEHDAERVIGYAETVEAAGEDLVATFYVAPGDLGDEILASAANKLRDGLSVGVQVVEGAFHDDGIYEVTAGVLREVSSVAVPAFAAARVTSVAATALPPAPAAPAAPRQIAAAGSGLMGVPAAPLPGPAHFTGAGVQTQAAGDRLDRAIEAAAEAFRQGGPAGFVTAALTDVVGPTDTIANQAQRDVLIAPQVLGELWQASQVSRPLIEAFGTPTPLRSWKVTGFRTVRPAFGVAEYAGRKAEIPSPGTYTVEPVEAKARRIAGAHDFDRVFLDLGDGAMLRSYLTLQTDNYRELTEQWFATDLIAGATSAGTFPSVLAALADASQRFRRIGAQLNVVALAPDLYSDLLTIRQQDAPWLYGGQASIDGEGATIGGVRFTSQTAIPAGTMLAADRRSATFFEHRNPPISVQAVNLPQGGVDVAVFGYVADLINDADALLSYTVTAPEAG